MRQMSATPQRDCQRGSSLIEALIGLLVVAIGMLGSAHWQLHLRLAVDLARQQSEAVRVAQTELESLRAFTSSAINAGSPNFATISSARSTSGVSGGGGTVFQVTRAVRDNPAPTLKELVVAVDWADRGGVQHEIRVASALAGQAPAVILPLARRSARPAFAELLGRHPLIPRDAHDLGDGRSVFKPITSGDLGWLFDNRSGRIVARCAGVAGSKANRQLRAGDLTSCTATSELLLSGRLRFAATSPLAADGNLGAARENPLPLTLALELSSTGHAQPPACFGEAVRMVDVGTTGSPRPIAVAIDATPAAQGLSAWTELGDRFWRYHCSVSPAAGVVVNGTPTAARWSGQLQLSPLGWALGHTTAAKQICRYSADTDRSGQIDRGAEAPGLYVDIDDTLVEQNFLVIGGDQRCPAAAASTQAGGSLPWSDANAATVPHQP